MSADRARGPVLAGLRVLDVSHQYSGALAASLLADLGADVIAVEHPSRMTIRTMLPRKGESLWWKVVGRGKRAITLDMASPTGRDMFLKLAHNFDVIIENFRAGTLERWGLGPEDLERAGVNVVLLRISGFGQTGPYRDRPGFGTIAEAMSGFAYLNGERSGPPMFPSTTLADGVAGLFGAFGALSALWNRQRDNSPSLGVEVVDIALFEGLFRLIPTQIATYDQLGVIPIRPGNKLTSHGVLRNLYRSSDDRYLCMSAVGSVAIGRILMAVGATNLVAELDAGVMSAEPALVEEFLNRCDAQVAQWSSTTPFEIMTKALQANDAVFLTVYNAKDIVDDPQYAARGDLVSVPDGEDGVILMQGVVPKYPARQHDVPHAGRPKASDNSAVYREYLHLDSDELDRLHDQGVV